VEVGRLLLYVWEEVGRLLLNREWRSAGTPKSGVEVGRLLLYVWAEGYRGRRDTETGG
jgi:hypothetical protein